MNEAKETLLDKARRKLYDKWMNSGIDMSYKQWESLKDSVQTSLHWATPRNERMLPEGEETQKSSDKKVDSDGDNKDEKIESRAPLHRQDSCHPTIVMINKQQDLRKKFRNYEI